MSFLEDALRQELYQLGSLLFSNLLSLDAIEESTEAAAPLSNIRGMMRPIRRKACTVRDLNRISTFYEIFFPLQILQINPLALEYYDNV